ncbi:MAG: aminopeptidase [Clostridia bacterium]|nr:aminopeptidase [Clostridia bacterium]
MKKTELRKYAKLIATMGANVQKGQDVLIFAELDQPEFVRILVDECYRLRARRVDVIWTDQLIEKMHQKKRSLATLSQVEAWEEARWEYRASALPVHIYLESEDPDGMNGIDQVKDAKSRQARYKVIKPYRDRMENKYQWCIAAVPGAAWAKKLFPDLRTSAAIEKLWEAILYTSRAQGDPIENWKAHNADLDARCAYLNSLDIDKLEYKSANGTDLTVGLLEGTVFMGGAEPVQGSGVMFNANIPSEEVFISPKRGVADGIVYASKPLSYQGELIEDFWIRFEGGRAVEVHAARNEALLREMISMDEGAAYLGECALVPYESPIRQSGILFYNTLFDENAACHLALGAGFTNTLKDYDKYTVKECYQMGINESMIHVDFMIGTSDLSITAITRSGSRVPVFRDGTWAF